MFLPSAVSFQAPSFSQLGHKIKTFRRGLLGRKVEERMNPVSDMLPVETNKCWLHLKLRVWKFTTLQTFLLGDSCQTVRVFSKWWLLPILLKLNCWFGLVAWNNTIFYHQIVWYFWILPIFKFCLMNLTNFTCTMAYPQKWTWYSKIAIFIKRRYILQGPSVFSI